LRGKLKSILKFIGPLDIPTIPTRFSKTLKLGDVPPVYQWIINPHQYGAIHDCPAIKWLMAKNFQSTRLLLPSNLAQQSRLSNSVGPHDSVSEPFVQAVVLGFNNCIHGVSYPVGSSRYLYRPRLSATLPIKSSSASRE